MGQDAINIIEEMKELTKIENSGHTYSIIRSKFM
ncbi:uncharacterized protein G2W53_040973 [Senna tora]|uniref:Uncharacterized protein n=1 Tax=Senna tora TaxID=362788 RepID=A0A834VYC7_9FABA|nr:uncharacterized protein G2W53_040973 [Senna tora]